MKLLAAVADSAERAIGNNVMVLDNSSSVKGNLFLFWSSHKGKRREDKRFHALHIVHFILNRNLEFQVFLTFVTFDFIWIWKKKLYIFAVSLETLPPPPPPPVNIYTTTTNNLNIFNDPRRSQSSVSTYTNIIYQNKENSRRKF